MTVRLSRRYASPEQAERIRLALHADQGTYVRTAQEGERLTFEVTAEKARSVRATVDDLLAAVGVAERTLGITVARR